MHAQVGKFLTQLACEVGKSAVEHLSQKAETDQRTNEIQAWARSQTGSVGAFSAQEAAKILAAQGLTDCSKDDLLACTGAVFGCMVEGIRFALEEVLEVSDIAAHMHDELFGSSEEAALAFLANVDRCLEDLHHGRIEVPVSDED